MTLTQIVVIVAGLVFGYRLVSHWFSPGTGDQRSQPQQPADQDASARRDPLHESAWGSAPAQAAPAWYQTLNVAESTSLEDIEHAYRLQIAQYHPDKVAKLGEDIRRLAEARSKEINGAYDTAVRLRGR